MADFVLYHKGPRMGPATRFAPAQAFTDSHSAIAPGDRLWIIAGEGTPRQYTLPLVFLVEQVAGGGQGFDTTISGMELYWSDTPQLLNSLPWFDDFRSAVGNFALGIQEIRPEFLDHFAALIDRTA